MSDYRYSQRFLKFLPATFIISQTLFAQPITQDVIPYQMTGADRYKVQFDSQVKPIVINQIHSWVMTVRTDDGRCVEGAVITVDGGMPEHDHGLPTVPQVRPGLNDCEYLIEGLRFHMAGLWELSFTIAVDDKTDTLMVALEL